MEEYRELKLDFPIKPESRYGYGKPSHAKLYDIINSNRDSYRRTLESFLDFKEHFMKIPINKSEDDLEPYWVNGSFPGLDSVALYAFLAIRNPNRFFEIGSGNSTRFARKAIVDRGLRTEITCIDPYAAPVIDKLADTVIREPLEAVNLDIFNVLEEPDILFVDGSHRCFTNSDATTVFLDILPNLGKDMLVQIHDIFLPDDYPPRWKDWFFSEQYLLAAYLLAEGHEFNIVLPNYFVGEDEELLKILEPIYGVSSMKEFERHGGSFWLQKT